MSQPDNSIRGTLARFLTHFPLWSLLLGTLAGVWLGDYYGLGGGLPLGVLPWLLGAAVMIALAFWIRKKAFTLLIAGILLGHLSHGIVIEKQRQGLHYVKSKPGATTSLRAVILDTGRSEQGPYLAKLIASEKKKESPGLPSKLRLIIITQRDDPTILRCGDIVHTEGRLSQISPPRNPHGFDLARWRHRQGADLQLLASEHVKIEGTSSLLAPLRTMAEWRKRVKQSITSGLDPESDDAQLIRAVVLGERPPQPSAMIDDFRNSGTLHVFAVSGLHVGMVGLLVGFTLSLLRAPRWAIIIFSILGMALYAGITGARPPAVRAVIMATVFLSGFLVRRRPILLNSLAASAILVLLWDGHQLFAPGFQLSYGVLLAIALFTRFWSKRLQFIGALDPFMPRLLLTRWQERHLALREHLQGSLSVSTAAWMGSTPLIWTHFGIITPVSILASIPLMLMIFGVLSLAMASLALGCISPNGAKGINHLNALLASLTRNSATGFASIPGSHYHRKRERPENGQIIIFDLPKGGGAQFLDFGGGILYDCGSLTHFRYQVQPSLTYLRASPDSLILSHADSSHCGAMGQCLSLYAPKQALIPRPDQRSSSYREFIHSAQRSHCKTITPRSGDCFPLGEHPSVYLEILHAPAELPGSGRADDTGLVTRLHWHGWTILFTADAGWITENRLLKTGMDLHADVLVMGRNRNDYTGQLRFIDAVAPQAIISSHSPFPEAERISPEWADSIRQRGILLLDQKLTGAVTLTLENSQMKLSPTLKDQACHMLTR